MTINEHNRPSRARGWQIGLLGAAISLLALWFILSQIDLALLGQALARARYIYLLPCLLLLLAGLWTRALRWRALLDDDLPRLRAFHILNVSYLVNGILPLRLGEVARAWLASRAESAITVPRALSTVVVERLLDLLTVVVLIALSASVVLPQEFSSAALALAPLAVGGLLILILLASQQVRALRLVAFVLRVAPATLRPHLTRLAEDVLAGFAPLSQPRMFARVVGWTVISWAQSLAAGYVIMFTFYERADLAAVSLYIAAASLAIAVPAVPGSIGTYEASIWLALSAFPAYASDRETGIALAVVIHAASLMLYAIVGGIGLLREGVSLRDLQAQASTPSTQQPITHSQ
jgi:uncharacterized protein (TIRG00374 family)